MIERFQTPPSLSYMLQAPGSGLPAFKTKPETPLYCRLNWVRDVPFTVNPPVIPTSLPGLVVPMPTLPV
jgi:hypothetical protein